MRFLFLIALPSNSLAHKVKAQTSISISSHNQSVSMNVLRVTNKVALPHSAVVGLQFVIVIFPDHTHLLFVRSQVMVKRGLRYNPIYWLTTH